MGWLVVVLCVGLGVLWAGGGDAADTPAKPATAQTRKVNETFFKAFDFSDTRDFDDARHGFIAPLDDQGVILDAKGRAVWDMTKFRFLLDAAAPDTVNPGLWRQMQLVMTGGLFKVCDGLYQVRNADLSNMTIFEGKTGIIVADPLVSVETARAALELYYKHRPRRPVVAVIYSHSHVDHYGGVKGIVSEDEVKSGRVKVIAPEGFLQAAVSENVFAGTVMSRRASYMYGNLLPPSPTGQVGAGLGTTTSSGQVSLIAPTVSITSTGQTMNIDGLDFEFMLAPGSEAPAEMHWYIKQFKAVTAAENCCHTLHNTYSLRGTRIRDPLAWSKYLDQTIALWGDKAEIMYGMHHWPVWGRDNVVGNLKMGRDGYRFINDQTLRLANHGLTPEEIAEQVEFPGALGRHWAMRGYYGSIYHNVRATYTLYLGWFDGNPSRLHPLSPVQAARKYVEYMGGAEAVMARARKDFADGRYRWVAQVMNQVVFAEPDNAPARQLTADALEQLGYQAQSGPWRNFYLTGARELRDGVRKLPTPITSTDTARAMSLDLFLDYLGTRIDSAKAGTRHLVINMVFPDAGETWLLELENGALSHRADASAKNADATVTMNRSVLKGIALGKTTLQEATGAGDVAVTGDARALPDLIAMLDTYEFWFNIVTP
jgi:alkyl sulfatase BDS1-like metallo-beta-lactamase superfamily hydrolase